MKYLDPKFSSRPASKEYRANYDTVFKGDANPGDPNVVVIEPGESVTFPMNPGDLKPVTITGLGVGRRRPKPRRRGKR